MLVINGASAGEDAESHPQQLELKVIIYSVTQSILFIFTAAAWVVFYFSCRAKAEHFDLALLADAVGVEDDQPPPTLNVTPGEAH